MATVIITKRTEELIESLCRIFNERKLEELLQDYESELILLPDESNYQVSVHSYAIAIGLAAERLLGVSVNAAMGVAYEKLDASLRYSLALGLIEKADPQQDCTETEP